MMHDTHLTRREALVVGLTGALLFPFGCQRSSNTSPHQNVASARAVPSPLMCPVDQEFIGADSTLPLAPEERAFINQAVYVWRTAVGPEETSARMQRLLQIPIIPPTDRLDLSNSMNVIIAQQARASQGSAFFVRFELEYQDGSGQTNTKLIEGFLFQNLVQPSSLFGLVASIGHESHHATQKQTSISGRQRLGQSSYVGRIQVQQETLWKESDAYERELKDLMAVSKFLRESPLISDADRKAYSQQWLTELAGAVHNCTFMHRCVVVQHHLASVSLLLLKLEQSISNHSDIARRLTRIVSEIEGLIEYGRHSSVSGGEARRVYDEVRQFVFDILAAHMIDQPQLLEELATTVNQYTPWTEKLDSAAAKLRAWMKNQQPLIE